MEQLTAFLISLLTAAGIPAIAAMPDGVAPRLTGPACAVQVEKLTLSSPGLAQYLGVREDPERGPIELYGAKLAATVLVQVYSPVSAGAPACAEAAGRVLDTLLRADSGLQAETVETAACVYDARYDHFLTPVRVQLLAWAYAESPEEIRTFTNFTLRGELQ